MGKKFAECLGLIPARSGSQRVPGKNNKKLAGYPLLAYTIAAARASGVFKRIIVSTDSLEIREVALDYGAEVPFMRPAEYASSKSPDIEWIKYTLNELREQGEDAGFFSILRPTSPFRQAKTIRRAWDQFLADDQADSLRAVEKCAQHPAKMWLIDDSRMRPVMENPDEVATPWHSMPYQELPKVFVQNACLEIARCDVPLEQGTISGKVILPFIMEGYEGHDINNPEDWVVAEYLVSNGLAKLPEIK